MTAEAFRRQLEAISLEYRQELPARLEEISTLWRDLGSGAAAPARLAELQRGLHSIVGSARTFGIAGVSEAAAEAESFLEPFGKRRKLPDPAQRAEFTRLLDALKRAAQ